MTTSAASGSETNCCQLLAVLAQRLHSVGRKPGRGERVADNVEQGRLVCRASCEPRRMQALPALRHSAAASTVTLGRAS